MSVERVEAVTLRSFPYGDTSLITRFLTREHGLLGVVARGVRKGGRSRSAVPHLFSSGALVVDVKKGRDLQNLREYTPERVRLGLSRSLVRLSGASLLADLVLRNTEQDGSPAVFRTLEAALDELEEVADEEVAAKVLRHAWTLTADMGYAPSFHECVECGRGLDSDEMARFDVQHGGTACADCRAVGPRVGPGARSDLEWFLSGEPAAHRPQAEHLPAHTRLFHEFVATHLNGGRPVGAIEYFLERLTLG